MNEPEDKPDGEYDAKVGKYECVEQISTEMCDDGVEETRVDYVIKQADRWKFTGWNKKRYEEIDWNS